jgi:hypothetical protein
MCYMAAMLRRLATVALALGAACSSQSGVKAGGSDVITPSKPSFTLFALAEVRGQIGPCGCTSDPLGDVARTAKLVAAARAAGPVLVVDAGSLLYSVSPVPAQLVAQEDLKADLLRNIYKNELHVAALGLGPMDLAKGPDAVRLPREVANLAPGSKIPTEAPKVIDVGGTKVGVFGVVASDALAGVAVTDPVAAGKAAVADLRGKGAQVVIALVQATAKKDAQHLVRDIGGVDIAVAGLGLNAPEPERTEISADKTGEAWVVIPANRGQIVSRVDVTLRPGATGALSDAVGSAVAAARGVELTQRIKDEDAEIAAFGSDKTADPAFVASKKDERTRLVAERESLATTPLVIPPTGSFFTLDQEKISKTLACDLPTQSKVSAYYDASGKANVAAAADKPVIPAAKGAATYVGMDKCSDCHQDAVDFWKKTVHATAWQTLVDRGQQFDYSCIGCHVTGFDKPGGTNLGHTDGLRDIQCETCHGPGSIHVAKGGNEKPLAIAKAPASDLCATQCHTKEHSDTFQYESYLRDITGKGHGEERRKQLGDGPTGKSLRTAAIAKAGASLGAGCIR